LDELSALDGLVNRRCSLAHRLWGLSAILYKAHVDPQRTGSST
jgi:hypothetical protein